MFHSPLHLRHLILKNRVFLAPLAGVSDIPFRRICQEMGAGLTYVEMLSSVAIRYGNKKTFQMMARHPKEDVLGVQVTGPSADDVSHAISILSTKEFETLDINMGCPVRKVVSTGCGSAILKDQPRLIETVQKARAATQKPLSAKIRLGYTRDSINVAESTANIAAASLDMLTIHGRTRADSYAIPSEPEKIQYGVSSAKLVTPGIITVGNGDIFGIEDARKINTLTNCDAIMISRGALGNPWIFPEILEDKALYPSFEEWFDVVMRHIDYQEEHFGKTKLSAILMRKHLLWYIKGFFGAKEMREQFNGVECLDIARQSLKDYANKIPKSAKRYEDSRSGILGVTNYDPKYEMDRELDRGVGHLGEE